MDIIEKIKNVLTNPTKFFAKQKTKSWGELVIYSLLSLISSIITTILVVGLGLQTLGTDTMFNLGWTMPIFTLIMTLVSVFVGSAILHIGVYILGGRGLLKTAAANIYSSTPSYLLGWIPFVSIVAVVWSFVLLIVGIAKQHKMSYLRALGALILSFLIIGIPVAIVTTAIAYSWFGSLLTY